MRMIASPGRFAYCKYDSDGVAYRPASDAVCVAGIRQLGPDGSWYLPQPLLVRPDPRFLGFRRRAEIVRGEWLSDRPSDAVAQCRANVHFFYCSLNDEMAVWFASRTARLRFCAARSTVGSSKPVAEATRNRAARHTQSGKRRFGRVFLVVLAAGLPIIDTGCGGGNEERLALADCGGMNQARQEVAKFQQIDFTRGGPWTEKMRVSLRAINSRVAKQSHERVACTFDATRPLR